MSAQRRFIDATAEERCEWTVTLQDGSKAQCGRRHTDGQLCTQHSKMRAAWACVYCGGNDENPPDHCADCSRPATTADGCHNCDGLGYRREVNGEPIPCDLCDAITAQAEGRVDLTNDQLRAEFERLANKFVACGIKRSRRGAYVNPSVARDWKWFQLGAAIAQAGAGKDGAQ
jgi:hypothetical protein